MRAVVVVAGILAVACQSSPPRGACEPRPAPGQLGTVCGFSNPEDLEILPAAGVMLVSQMAPLAGGAPGSIAAATLASLAADRADVWRLWPPEAAGERPAAGAAPTGEPSCTTPPDPAAFAPHGIATRARDGVVQVAVVSHAPREAVELFVLSGRGRDATLRWTGCVPLPPGTAGNDLAQRADGGLVVANCLPAFGGLRGVAWMLASTLGKSTGDVLAWSPGSGWEHLPDTTSRTANGVAVGDGGRVWFTESGAHQVARLDAGGGGRVTRAIVEGAPDNLSWTSRGTLLTATHLSAPAFMRCAFVGGPCRAPWALVEIDPATLRTTDLLRHDGAAIGAVAGAAEYQGRLYLSAVFDDRIGVWQPAR